MRREGRYSCDSGWLQVCARSDLLLDVTLIRTILRSRKTAARSQFSRYPPVPALSLGRHVLRAEQSVKLRMGATTQDQV